MMRLFCCLLISTMLSSVCGAAEPSEKSQRVAPKFTASIPIDWKVEQIAKTKFNDYRSLGNITAAYVLPNKAHVQFRQRVMRGDVLEFTEPNDMYELMLEDQSICCEWSFCIPKPLDSTDTPFTTHECKYEATDYNADFTSQTPPLTAFEASGIGHRVTGDLSVYVTLKRKTIGRDVIILTVAYSQGTAQISPEDRKIHEQMIKSIR